MCSVVSMPCVVDSVGPGGVVPGLGLAVSLSAARAGRDTVAASARASSDESFLIFQVLTVLEMVRQESIAPGEEAAKYHSTQCSRVAGKSPAAAWRRARKSTCPLAISDIDLRLG